MLMAGCQERTMSLVGDPGQDGAGGLKVSSSYSELCAI